jgi:hypothetical protein
VVEELRSEINSIMHFGGFDMVYQDEVLDPARDLSAYCLHRDAIVSLVVSDVAAKKLESREGVLKECLHCFYWSDDVGSLEQ